MLRLGVVNEESWKFFNDLYSGMCDRYVTSVFRRRTVSPPFFKERVNRRLLRQDLERFLKQNDVVFFEWASELLALASSLPRHSALVTRLHRYELYRWASHINWDSVDRVLLVSDAKRRAFCQRFPAQTSKTAVCPVSVDLKRFHPRPVKPEPTVNIGTLCHLTPRKRVYDLLITFAEVLQCEPNLRMIVGGDPRPEFSDYFEAIHDLIRRLQLQGHVRLNGYVEDPSEWYCGLDIFVSNSYDEGLQVAPMEAMASGCFTLSHSWSGAAELLPEEYLCRTNEELKNKIIGYCRLSQTERGQHRSRMREIAASRFDVECTKRLVFEVIEAAAELPR